MARLFEYTPEKGEEICSKLADGISLRTICQEEGMPDKNTFFRWLREFPELRDQYARAKEESTDALNEILIELGDRAIEHSEEADVKAANAVVSAYKLKADNLRWVMSKLKPKKYGEKLDVTSDGKALPQPIYGGVSKHHSDDKDIPTS